MHIVIYSFDKLKIIQADLMERHSARRSYMLVTELTAQIARIQ